MCCISKFIYLIANLVGILRFSGKSSDFFNTRFLDSGGCIELGILAIALLVPRITVEDHLFVNDMVVANVFGCQLPAYPGVGIASNILALSTPI